MTESTNRIYPLLLALLLVGCDRAYDRPVVTYEFAVEVIESDRYAGVSLPLAYARAHLDDRSIGSIYSDADGLEGVYLNQTYDLRGGRDVVVAYSFPSDLIGMDLNFMEGIRLRDKATGATDTIEVCLPQMIPLARPLRTVDGRAYRFTLFLDLQNIHPVNGAPAVDLEAAVLGVEEI